MMILKSAKELRQIVLEAEEKKRLVKEFEDFMEDRLVEQAEKGARELWIVLPAKFDPCRKELEVALKAFGYDYMWADSEEIAIYW
jgi:hypothetical protein